MSNRQTNSHRPIGFLASVVIITAGFAVPGVAMAADASLYHVPPAEVSANEPLTVRAQVAAGWTADVDVMYRPLGRGAWSKTRFERSQDDIYEAIIPGERVLPPGLEYYIVSRSGETSTLHFASSKAPHQVFVYESDSVMDVDREMQRYRSRRAQARVSYELVDFGTRTIQGQRIADSYYRLDADFSYRVFRFPLRTLRFGFTRMLGTTPNTPRGDGTCDPCERSAGFRAGGWTELRWRLRDGIDLDTRMLIQATETGFGFGGRGEIRLGREKGSHFAVGTELITEVGSTFFVRLAWLTVPGVPMAASIELSDYPYSGRDHGVRLLYDVAHDFDFGLRVGARVGYQARDQNIGGISGGGNISVDF